jgi:hypothetical protein
VILLFEAIPFSRVAADGDAVHHGAERHGGTHAPARTPRALSLGLTAMTTADILSNVDARLAEATAEITLLENARVALIEHSGDREARRRARGAVHRPASRRGRRLTRAAGS